MYIPASFREDRLAAQHSLIRAFPFAVMISAVEGAPFASHVPFLLDPGRGPLGTLRAHVARQNPHWHGFADGREALVVFQGPHAYISPTWYDSQPAVPTWNYAAVHAYGVPRIADETALRTILLDLVAAFETPNSPYEIADDYLARMAKGVVGFEIEMTRIEGKVKMGQNRSVQDREHVLCALAESDRAGDRELAEWMVSRAVDAPEAP